MQFLYPSFLFALFALAIPVIIHLFNFRRFKKIYFTNVRFLTDLQQEQKSRNKLRHLLLLCIRLLALACIVLAFSHPFVPNKNKMLNPGRKFISIYIDNSYSMSNTGSEGELLLAAKKHAEEIASGYKEGDAFNLVTNDFELKHQHWVNRSDFIKLVNEVNVSPAFHKLSEVNDRIAENFRKADLGNRLVYFISDFQDNMADFGAMKTDSSIHQNYVSLEAPVKNNVSIDSVWFESPLWQINQKNTLYVKIVNSGTEKITDHTLNLSINGKGKGIANFSIPEQSSTVVEIVYTITDEGENKGVVSLDDYPITFDNQFFFTYNVSKTIPVLVINGSNESKDINKAFAAEKTFEVTNVMAGNLDYSTLGRYSFIVLNEIPEISTGLGAALKSFMERSGNILLLPAANDINLESYGTFLSLSSSDVFSGINTTALGMSPINKQDPFFANIGDELSKNVSMPAVKKYFKLQKSPNSKERVLLELSNGDPFLITVPEGKGYLFVSSAPLGADWSNIAQHWLLLPSLYKMAFYHNKEEPLYYTIDKDNVINVPSLSGDEKKLYSLTNDSTEFIPNQKMLEGTLQLFVEGMVRQAGFFRLKNNQKDAMAQNYIYAFNYNRLESVMKFENSGDIKEKITGLDVNVLNPGKISLKKEVKSIDAGINLWKWFIWASLVFLLGEMIITRFWK